MDDLERDAFEVLSLVRTIKNTFAPINQVPPDVLSLIPDYYDENDVDRASIVLTHVCRGWRDMFISRSSLWTRFDFTDTDKTRTYIQRSQSSPLKFCLVNGKVIHHAFALVIPHIRRLESLTVDRFTLSIHLTARSDLHVSPFGSAIYDVLFNRDLSSLLEFHLRGFIAHLPWRNLKNLRVVKLGLGEVCETNQILDFLESAPLLHTVSLAGLMPGSSDTPPERIVHLRHLKDLTIEVVIPPLIPLHHLHIPTGASLTISQLHLHGEESPLLDYLPERSPTVSNLSHVTTINLLLSPNRKCVRLSGPSGSLRLLVASDAWGGESPSYHMDREIFSSLTHLELSGVRTLVASEYRHPSRGKIDKSPIFQALSSANNLRTLVLICCQTPSFVLALDPKENRSNLVLCSNLERLVIYFKAWFLADADLLKRMTKNRTSRGAKLSLINLVDLRARCARKEREMVALEEHVARVEYGVFRAPTWDKVPDQDLD